MEEHAGEAPLTHEDEEDRPTALVADKAERNRGQNAMVLVSRPGRAEFFVNRCAIMRPKKSVAEHGNRSPAG